MITGDQALKNTFMKKKLVLFDIDGTLVHHIVERNITSRDKFAYAIKKVFGIDVDFKMSDYFGMGDRQILGDVLQKHEISKKKSVKKLEHLSRAMHEYMNMASSDKRLYKRVESAYELVKKLSRSPRFVLGLLSGNMKRIAYWKLSHTGLDGYFHFGVFGEEADDRIGLAKRVQAKAKQELNQEFKGQDIIVIGDTIHDIRCGKAIGAITIAVTTGDHRSENLSAERPDLLVDSLMDKSILDLLGRET